MNFQEEKFKDIVEELKPMFIRHWEELANHKEIRPLDVNCERYTALNETNNFRVFTARTPEGKLIGYGFFFVDFNLHYQTWVHASVDVYWIDPDYRALGVGRQFIAEIEKWLKTIGVNSIVMMDKLNHSHESFFVKLGYRPIEQLYEKII